MKMLKEKRMCTGNGKKTLLDCLEKKQEKKN